MERLWIGIKKSAHIVIPAKAGIHEYKQSKYYCRKQCLIPAFAGMTAPLTLVKY